MKFYKYGDPHFKQNKTSGREIKEFLDSAIAYEDKISCLIYPFSKQGSGYGSAKINGRTTLVHRYVCETLNGKPPEDKPFALHSCGNGRRGCCNPHHLRWGSHSENMIDRYAHAK